MRTVLAVALTAATLMVTCSASASTQARPLSGRWLGSYALGSARTFFTVQLARRDAIAEYPALERQPLISRVTLSSRRVSFTLDGRTRFTGRLTGSRIVGTVRRGRRRGRFELVRHPAVPPRVLRRYTGLYRIGERLLTVFESSPRHGLGLGGGEGEGGLRYVDLGTGTARGLYALSPTRFAAGPALGVGHPIRETRSFPFLARSRIGVTRHEVSFVSSGARLAGRLHLPTSPGPHPAVVMLHGAGPGLRSHDYLQAYVYLFVANGFAVLTYDKRGYGGSTGATPTDRITDETMNELADDALAGVAFLRGRPEVNPSRVGVWGLSQGAWVATVAASRSSDLAWSIHVSGGAATQAEEDVFSDLTGDGARRPRPEIVEREVSRAGPGTFDPTPYLRAMRAPALWLIGAFDLSVPPIQSARRLEAVRSQNAKPFTIEFFRRGDHELYDTRHGLLREVPFTRGYLPQLFPTLRAWLAVR